MNVPPTGLIGVSDSEGRAIHPRFFACLELAQVFNKNVL